MGFDNIFHYLNLTLAVFFVDLLLSGDNAVVIALACRSLSPALTRRAVLIGTGGAIALRILLTSFASILLTIPLLKLAGGLALTAIAVKLTIDEEEATADGNRPPRNPSELWPAVGTIIVADLVMSVDNVVALAAITQGSTLFLAAGLLMSVSLLMYGSLFVAALLRRYPVLISGGGALLGWIAGDIAISDPMIADWVNQQSPALSVAVPLLVAVFVLVESRIINHNLAHANKLRPRHWPRPVIAKPKIAAIEPATERPVNAAASLPIAAKIEPRILPEVAKQATAQARSAGSPAVDSDTKDKEQAPWVYRFAISVLVAAVVTVTVLWLIFRSLTFSG